MTDRSNQATVSAWDEIPVNEKHREELIKSAILPAVAAERGYRTMTKQIELTRFGFSRVQANPPGLWIPIRGITGEEVGFQFKADMPRRDKDGDIVKYETPSKAKLQLDVPRRAINLIRDPDRSLFITEGAKKVDAGASQGLAIVGVPGVWAWKSPDVIAGFDQIDFKSRTVYIVFDSDWNRKRQVRLAASRLTNVLRSRGAVVFVVYLPESQIGVKTGLDDYFVAGGSVADLTAKYAREPEEMDDDAASDRLCSVLDALPDADRLAGTSELVIPQGYAAGDRGITYLGGPVLPTHAFITARLIDRATGDESVRVAFRDLGQWRTVETTRDVIASARKIIDLARAGLPVTSGNAGDVVDWFATFMETNRGRIPVTHTSATLGWQGDRGFLLPGRMIEGENTGGVSITFAPPDAGSAQHARAFTASGNLDGWRQAIAPVSRFERVQFGVHAALAAPLLEVLGCPSFIVDYAGETSGGKTSTLRIAGSAWGQSDPAQPHSVLATFQSTRVFRERLAALSCGLPVIVDDTMQANKASEIQAFLYDMGSGQGRGRGSIRGVQATANWRTVAMISGESPATSATEAGGTKARTLTIWGRPFGRDAGVETVISDVLMGISENHGHAGPLFVEWLIANRGDWPEWRRQYHEWARNIAKHAGGGSVIGRISGYLAAVAMAGLLAGDADVVPWRFNRLPDGLVAEIAGEARSSDVAAEALIRVLSWAAGRAESFYRANGTAAQPTGGWLGRWDGEPDSWHSISFMSDQLRRALEANGYSDYEGIIRRWADRDWLDVGKGDGNARRMKRVRMGDHSPAWAYVITRNAEEEARQALCGGAE